jgi:hypothetical protein
MKPSKNLSLRIQTSLPLSIKIKPDLLTAFLVVYKLSGRMVELQLYGQFLTKTSVLKALVSKAIPAG